MRMGGRERGGKIEKERYRKTEGEGEKELYTGRIDDREIERDTNYR